MNYFKELFDRLSDDGIVSTDSEELKTPEELKVYMMNILESNMQYDFGIRFNDRDVEKFAEAITEGDNPHEKLLWEYNMEYLDMLKHCRRIAEDKGPAPLKDYIDIGFNSIRLEGDYFWKNDDEYSSSLEEENIPESILNTIVEYDDIWEDDDGYDCLDVRKVEGK